MCLIAETEFQPRYFNQFLSNVKRLFADNFMAKPTTVNRGSYMSAHVLLNLLNEMWKRDKRRGLSAFYLFFATS